MAKVNSKVKQPVTVSPQYKPRTKRRYSSCQVDLAEALRLRYGNGLSHEAIGKQLGVSASSVYKSLRRFEGLLELPEMRNNFKSHRAEILTSVEIKILEELLVQLRDGKRLTPDRLTFSLKLVNDMRRLEENLSTVNVAHAYQQVTREVVELEDELKRIEAEIEQGGQKAGFPPSMLASNPQQVAEIDQEILTTCQQVPDNS